MAKGEGVPSPTPKLKLPGLGLCRQAALDFAEGDLAWESAWAPGVTGPDLEKARGIHQPWMGLERVVKMASFTLDATTNQATRWKQVAEAEGYALSALGRLALWKPL